jgi:HSP20 family protein
MHMTDKKTTRSQPDQDGTSLVPWRDTGLASMFDEFFQPFFPRAMQSLLQERASFRQPILDVQDRGDYYSLTAELPGFTKDEVQVKVGPQGLELKAEKTEDESQGEKGVRTTSSRSYYQYLSLPDQVLTGKVDGTMKNGILELKLPKRAPKLKDDYRRVDLK